MLAEWSEFFVAAAGASAALAGLIIVAMSVSIDQLVTIPGMTSRGATAIAMLVLVAVTSLAGLIPGLEAPGFGAIVLAFAIAGLVLATRSLGILVGSSTGHRERVASLAKGGIGLLPFAIFVAGGILVVIAAPGGLLLMALGGLVAFIVSVIDAWVMLVEIRR